MKNRIIYCIVSLFVLSVLGLSKNCRAEELSQKPESIILSGTVSFDDYKKGQIIVEIYQGRSLYKSIVIPKPGSFSIELPKNLGEVLIIAINKEMGEGEKTMESRSFGVRAVYAHNPVAVGSENIDGININFTRKGKLLSEEHKGNFVTISGNVRFDGYRSGKLAIVCSSKLDMAPDIAVTTIDSPGRYTLKVPANIGVVYLFVRNIKEGKLDMGDKGAFKGHAIPRAKLDNPIHVGSKNIEADDIVIVSQSLLMDEDLGQTVNISGEINVKNYQGEKIYINISTKDQGQADVNIIELSGPGTYSTKVPQNIGKIFIKADVGQGSRGKKGKCKQPLDVATEDIKGVDIELE